MTYNPIIFLDRLLWVIMAMSVAYVAFYALVYALCRKPRGRKGKNSPLKESFLVLIPAYSEDNVIIHTVEHFLLQYYPSDKYHVVVISDHQKRATNEHLCTLPITVLRPTFIRSSKAKALQFAMAETKDTYDKVVILDADNIVNPDFLHRLNALASHGYKAIQCHRRAKNADSSVSVLDGVSEEINNTLFRKAHNAIGLSSALIGSGMCFDFKWFKENVDKLSTAGEDRELEVLLLTENIFIKYEESIFVYDEKVSNAENFQRQRQRWMSAQVNCLLAMIPLIPRAILHFNINFIDKTVQQMLIPRSMLVVGILMMALTTSAVDVGHSIKWWSLLALTCLSLFLAIPSDMRKKSLFAKSGMFLKLAVKMIRNIRHIDRKNEDFIHTEHN